MNSQGSDSDKYKNKEINFKRFLLEFLSLIF